MSRGSMLRGLAGAALALCLPALGPAGPASPGVGRAGPGGHRLGSAKLTYYSSARPESLTPQRDRMALETHLLEDVLEVRPQTARAAAGLVSL